MTDAPRTRVRVTVEVNDRERTAEVPARTTLADLIREDFGLTGTKLGCEHGVCGACTVIVDGDPVRSCLMLAAQADGRSVRTVEGLADGPRLNRLQQCFRDAHGLQCGFCTAGFLMSATAVLEESDSPTRDAVVDAVSGSLCRCTGYETILSAILAAAEPVSEESE